MSLKIHNTKISSSENNLSKMVPVPLYAFLKLWVEVFNDRLYLWFFSCAAILKAKFTALTQQNFSSWRQESKKKSLWFDDTYGDVTDSHAKPQRMIPRMYSELYIYFVSIKGVSGSCMIVFYLNEISRWII